LRDLLLAPLFFFHTPPTPALYTLSLHDALPISIHLVLLRVDGVLGRRPFVAALTLLLVAQFLISTEIFATLAAFGAIAVVIGFVDRKSTRLNSSHVAISYAVSCLKKKKQQV